jgi:hypothetical protein
LPERHLSPKKPDSKGGDDCTCHTETLSKRFSYVKKLHPRGRNSEEIVMTVAEGETSHSAADFSPVMRKLIAQTIAAQGAK